MASTKKAPYSARIKMWTDFGTLESDGSARGCIMQMFRCLPADQRTALLERMRTEHDELVSKGK